MTIRSDQDALHRLVLALVLVSLTVGCGATRSQFSRFALLRRQAIPQDATAEQICRHVNANVTSEGGAPALRSWRSDHIQVTMSGMPAMLPATLAVQSPRDLRLRIAHPITHSDQADLGSNGERFWCWAEENGPHLMTAEHRHAHLVAKQLQIPFEPDWLIDVLGVRPLDPSELERRPTQNPNVVELAERYRLPDGHAAERITVVDLRQGRVIGHEVRRRGRTIAEARITSHNECPDTGLVMPGTIRLKWPDQNVGLTMRIARSEANPPDLGSHLFNLPRRAGVEVCDLTQRLGPVAAMGRPKMTSGPRELSAASTTQQATAAGLPNRTQTLGTPWTDAETDPLRPRDPAADFRPFANGEPDVPTAQPVSFDQFGSPTQAVDPAWWSEAAAAAPGRSRAVPEDEAAVIQLEAF